LSYLVLARKSRPRLFSEVVGQKAVVRTLQNGLEQNRVAHAMIFSGVRGVGKTTLARIVAKALNCEQGPAPEPCNQCISCVGINDGSNVDLTEIDGASNRGIQEIRELKENIRFMPSGSRYKIIIIDEVHMLTTEAFNALLKTLEEPPEHVYFIFATTELHKIPVTILSRCQRYELQRIKTKELTEYFYIIAEKEGVSIESAALDIIVREAGGSVRDGLSLLDQIFSYCGKTVIVDDVIEVLGLVSNQVISELTEALLAGQMTTVLEVVDRTYNFGMDLKRFINDLLTWFRALVVCSISKKPEKLLDLPDNDMVELTKCAGKYPSQTLVLMFNVLMENLEKAGYSSRPRYALEMALIKTVQARDVVPVSRILDRLDDVIKSEFDPGYENGVHDVMKDAPVSPAGEKKTLPNKKNNTIKSSDPDVITEKSVKEEKNDPPVDLDSPDTVNSPSAKKTPSTGDMQAIQDLPETSSEKNAFNRTVRRHWNDFVEYVRERKPWMASALQMASVARLEGEDLVIEYENSANCRLLRNKENITPLTEFALGFFQQEFRIRFYVPDTDGCKVDPSTGNKVKMERQSLANDTLVLTAVDIFNGEVGDIRIGPRFRKPIDEKESIDREKQPDE
jgi:DNA polymerase-3 subunit gamma/tau